MQNSKIKVQNKIAGFKKRIASPTTGGAAMTSHLNPLAYGEREGREAVIARSGSGCEPKQTGTLCHCEGTK